MRWAVGRDFRLTARIKKMKYKPYAERETGERTQVMDTCAAAGSHFYERTPRGFRVAVGRGRYAATVAALLPLGFQCVRLARFPLGRDTPSEHLRHDSQGVRSCCWLFADFTESNE